MIRHSIAIGGLMLLAACGKEPVETPKTETAPVAAPASQAKAVSSLAYVCEKDMPITAIYGTNAEGKADVALIVKDMDLRLVEGSSPEGQRFTSEQGLEAGNGIIWWVRGNEAQLQRAPLADLAKPEAGVTIRSCKLKNKPDENPGNAQ